MIHVRAFSSVDPFQPQEEKRNHAKAVPPTDLKYIIRHQNESKGARTGEMLQGPENEISHLSKL